MYHRKKCDKLSQAKAMSGHGGQGKQEMHNEEGRLYFENRLGKQKEILCL